MLPLTSSCICWFADFLFGNLHNFSVTQEKRVRDQIFSSIISHHWHKLAVAVAMASLYFAVFLGNQPSSRKEKSAFRLYHHLPFVWHWTGTTSCWSCLRRLTRLCFVLGFVSSLAALQFLFCFCFFFSHCLILTFIILYILPHVV